MSLTIENFEEIKEQFIQATSEERFLKEVSFAAQHFSKNKLLQKCSAASIIESVLNVAQTGLTLNPVMKLAYLVPRYINGGYKCCLEPSYMGLAKLLTDTGSVKSINCQIVYQHDMIILDSANEDKVKEHVPYWLSGYKVPGDILGVYSIATLHDGTKHHELMGYGSIMEIRERSESYKAYKANKISSCTWIADEGEMSRKTTLKRHTKYLPKSEQWEHIQTAIEVDNYDYGISDGQQNYINSLLGTAEISEDEKDSIAMELSVMSADRASVVIQKLKDNQLDPMLAGNNYNMGDVHNKLDQIEANPSA